MPRKNPVVARCRTSIQMITKLVWSNWWATCIRRYLFATSVFIIHIGLWNAFTPGIDSVLAMLEELGSVVSQSPIGSRERTYLSEVERL